jgi:hypothetical protein
MIRIAILCVLVACSGSDPLRADVEMICGATKATGGNTFIEIGPYIAEHAKTDLMTDLFLGLRKGERSLDDFFVLIRGAMKKTGVEHCETLDVLMAHDPRKKTE